MPSAGHTRQTLGYSAPAIKASRRPPSMAAPRLGDVEIPGGKYSIGATKDFPFVFDNEKWAHEVIAQTFSHRPGTGNQRRVSRIRRSGRLPPSAAIWSDEGWRLARIRRFAPAGKILRQVLQQNSLTNR